MRLWHKALIPYLPALQLRGQYREVFLVATLLRRQGTPNHLLVNKVQRYPFNHLAAYLRAVTTEMEKRQLKYDKIKVADLYSFLGDPEAVSFEDIFKDWHNDRYLRQCLYNLQEKADCGRPTNEEWVPIETTFKTYF
ncbi:MAG: pyrimidine dimer DNA glycosylase/endonuclease V [Acidaminococcaceae bacterium]